jgi:uncharacterized protein YqfA (UPF0365 family)
MDAMIIVWIAASVIGLVIFLWFFPVTLWFQALISGVRISLIQLVLMRWRGVSPNTIVMAMVTGTKAGLKLYANELEAHYLAKGNVPKVVNALISADKANISLCEVVRLKLVGIELKSCLCSCHHRHHDSVWRNPSPAHENQLDERDANSGNQRLEPQGHREEPEEDHKADDSDCGPYENHKVHISLF